MFRLLTLVFLITILKNSISDLESLCKKYVDKSMMNYYVCTCTQQHKNFEPHGRTLIFDKAKSIKITNCSSVHLFPEDIAVDGVEELQFQHIGYLYIDLIFDYQFRSFLLENVDSVEHLSRANFLQVTQLDNLTIKNSNISLIDTETFQDIRTKNVTFKNVTLNEAKTNSLHFRFDQNKNSKVSIDTCKFHDLEENAVSIHDIETIEISNSEFQSSENHNVIKLYRTTYVVVMNNIFPCITDHSCNSTALNIIEDLSKIIPSNDMCKVVTYNYCDSEKTISLLDYVKRLKQCHIDLKKYNIEETCASHSNGSTNSLSVGIFGLLFIPFFLPQR